MSACCTPSDGASRTPTTWSRRRGPRHLKDLGSSSFFRGARARRLLASGMSMVDILADHAGFPNAICRHVDERDVHDDKSETIFSVLLDLDEQRMGIAEGPPCENTYEWVTLRS